MVLESDSDSFGKGVVNRICLRMVFFGDDECGEDFLGQLEFARCLIVPPDRSIGLQHLGCQVRAGQFGDCIRNVCLVSHGSNGM